MEGIRRSLCLGAAEGHVFVANPREVLVFDQDGRVVHRQGSHYAFRAADFRGSRGVTADTQLQLRIGRLPELQETSRWLFDHENRPYGYEECQVTALALDDDGLWVGIHDVSLDPEESRFMEPEFKTTFSLRRYSLDGTLRRSTALPSKVNHLKVHGSRCWVGLECGRLARVQGTDLHIFDGSPSCTALEVNSSAVWVGRRDGSVEQRHPDSGEILRGWAEPMAAWNASWWNRSAQQAPQDLHQALHRLQSVGQHAFGFPANAAG